MTDRLDPQVTVVTGGSSGIGRAAVDALSRLDRHLVLLGRRLSVLQDAAADLPSAEAIELDLADVEAVSGVAQTIATKHPVIASIVNCAAVSPVGRAENTSLDVLVGVLGINTVAPYVLLRDLFEPLAAHGSASVVNVASVSALHGVAAQSAYSASKGALVSLTQALAAEWGRHGIRVNAVAPGVVNTPLSRWAHERDDYRSYISASIPLGRWGEPADIGDVIAFFCSDASRYITGQTLAVDGGLGSLRWMSSMKAH